MPAIGGFPVLFAPLFQSRQEVIVHCVHPLISGYWSSYWSNPRPRLLDGAGDSFRKRRSCFRDGSLQSRKCQGVFLVQAPCLARSLPHQVVGKYINKTNDSKARLSSTLFSLLRLPFVGQRLNLLMIKVLSLLKNNFRRQGQCHLHALTSY